MADFNIKISIPVNVQNQAHAEFLARESCKTLQRVHELNNAEIVVTEELKTTFEIKDGLRTASFDELVEKYFLPEITKETLISIISKRVEKDIIKRLGF